MNLKCLICSDLFTPSSEIHATPCGHLFHFHCLAQWLERSRTCPQCRNKATSKSIHRVYLSVDESGETTDFGTLQNKCDNLQFEINLKNKDIKNVGDKYEAARKQVIGLREEIKSQEDRSRVLESAMHALKEQVTFFKSKAKESEKLEDELKRLRNRLKDVEHVEIVLNGNREQVNDMLRHNRDPQSLTILVSTLKKELIDSDKRRKQIQARLKEAQNESQNYKLELAQLNKHNNHLQHEAEAHKHCEMERHYLKQKISQLSSKSETESPSSADTSIRRIVSESPAPLLKLIPLKDEDITRRASLSVAEKVQAIKDSDSPYLRVQSSGIGLSGLTNYIQAKPSSNWMKTNNKFSMFKTRPLNMEKLKMPSASMSYDGLGGHAKDEHFPSPQPPKIGVKRTKSATITSAKYRKLAPGSQKRLNEFFRDTESDCND